MSSRHHAPISSINGRLLLAFIVITIILGPTLAPSRSASAATTIIVTTTEHELNSDDDCSLSEAITAANSDTAVDACPAGDGADTIELQNGASYVLTYIDNVSTGEGTGPNGLPQITSGITIEGNGAMIVRGESAPPFRIFKIPGSGDLSLRNVAIENGYAGGGREGGGISNFGVLSLVDCSFSRNRASSGGAIYADDLDGHKGYTASINSRFYNNEASNRGGSIHTEGLSLVIIDSTVANNRAGRGGGGIWSESPTIILGSEISSNQAEGLYSSYGGGVHIVEVRYRGGAVVPQVLIVNSTINGNSAETNGGGLYIEDNYDIDVTLANSVVFGNFAGQDGGSAYIRESALNVLNSSLSGNQAMGQTGGIFVEDRNFGLLTLNNSILWANSDVNGMVESSQISVLDSPSTVLFNVIQDEDPNDGTVPFDGAANGNIDDDPLFVRNPDDGGDGWGVGDNDDYGDLHLQPGSPAIDAGSNSLLPADTADIDGDDDIDEPLPIDLDGDPRVFDGIVDMGADEFVRNDPPTADAGGPYLVARDQSIMLEGSGYDPESGSLTYSWTPADKLDDAAIEDPNFTANKVGIWELTLTVNDPGGLSDADTTYVVVYDPAGGFVTGGGWIDSPEGAYLPDSSLTGKANFGFVSKYKKGASIPTGNTEFQLKAGGMNFHSDSYDWLVVAGSEAKFKGSGTINGKGDFGFMFSAVDAAQTPSTDVDLFRIRIWDKDKGDVVVYDNLLGEGIDAYPTTAIGGGHIIVHKRK